MAFDPVMTSAGAVALAGGAQQMVPVPPLRLPDVNEWLLVAGLVMIVLDIVLGLSQAVATHTVESSAMRKGLWHKVAYLGAWGVAWVFAFAMQFADLGFTVPTVDAVSVYVIAMEGVSCLENVSKLNPDLSGSALMRAFAGAKKAEEKEDEKKKEDENA